MAEIFIPRPIVPLQPAQTVQASGTAAKAKSGTSDFESVLREKLSASELKFSGHALKRLQSRGISLTGEQMDRLVEAVNRVEAKGGRESLVLLDDVAMVVSVKNRTVITAVDREGLKENVFTNIDSAVIG